jgi:hypothetical protein
VYSHLDEEKVCNVGAWVLDIRVTNRMSRCRVTFMKLDTVVLSTVHFGDDSVAQINGHGTVMFVCKNGKSRSLIGVYFIPRLFNEAGHKININTSMIKIRELGDLLLVRVKREVNRLYLLHIKLTQAVCFMVCGRGDEVAWHWHEHFSCINMAALQKLAQDELVHGLPKIG